MPVRRPLQSLLLLALMAATLLLPLAHHDHLLVAATTADTPAEVAHWHGAADDEHHHDSDNLHGHNPADHAHEVAAVLGGNPRALHSPRGIEPARLLQHGKSIRIAPPRRPPRSTLA